VNNLKEEIYICLDVIEKYFTFLKIMGLGFMGILSVHSLIKNIFGEIIAKYSLVISGFIVILIILTIFRKFAIIKAIREKEEKCKK